MAPAFMAMGMSAASAATASTILTVGSTIMQVMGSMNQADNMRSAAAANAENARRSAEANKKQLDYEAGQAEASGQHEAEAARRKSALMLSRANAVAAASGGGPLDESLMSGIVGEGEKEAGYRSYSSRERAIGLRYRGDVGTYEANAKGRQGIIEANAAADATIMGGLAKGAMGLASLSPGAPPGFANEVGSIDRVNSFDDGSMMRFYR